MTFPEGKPTTKSLLKVNVHMYIIDLFHHLKLFWVGFSMTIGIQKYSGNKSHKRTKRVEQMKSKIFHCLICMEWWLQRHYISPVFHCLIFKDISLFDIEVILLMAEILHHLGCMKPYKYWDKLPINWCRISAINGM